MISVQMTHLVSILCFTYMSLTNVHLVHSQKYYSLVQESMWTVMEATLTEEGILGRNKVSAATECIQLCNVTNDCRSIRFKEQDHASEVNCILQSTTAVIKNTAISNNRWVSITKTFTYPKVKLTPRGYGLSTQGYNNIAVEKPTNQSSTYPDAYSYKAVDGNKNVEFYDGFCSSTLGGPNPWWKVDLLRIYKVYAVAITRRGDCDHCIVRLSKLQIRVGNNNDVSNALCAYQDDPPPMGQTTLITCIRAPIPGRYVTIQVLTGYLTFCEVEIIGV